jgi:hypothetical protein
VKSCHVLLRNFVFLAIVGGSVVTAHAEDAGSELVQMVVTLLADNDKDVRAVGLEQVRNEAKGEAATKQFAAQLAKIKPAAQVALLSALADRGDVAARAAVVELLTTTKDEAVKIAGIEALGQLGEPSDAHRFVQSLSAGSKAEKSAARASLIQLPGEAVGAVIAGDMKQAQPSIRVTLIEVLAKRRALDTIPDLLSAAIDADPDVRAAAMAALGQLAGSEHLPGMVQGVLKTEKSPQHDAAERAVLAVCDRIKDPEKQAEPLLAVMNQLNEADRTAMLSTLGRVGGTEALKVVEAAIASSVPQQHESGLRGLCNWPNASVAPRLIELVSSDQHPEHRAMALAAVIRVAPLADERPASEKLALLQKALTMCTRDEERKSVVKRARAIRTMESLHFVVPYLDQPEFAQQACETVVELAHHRGLREPNKAEFDPALDKVIATSKDPVVVERANRYKKNQTWAKPTVPDGT